MVVKGVTNRTLWAGREQHASLLRVAVDPGLWRFAGIGAVSADPALVMIVMFIVNWIYDTAYILLIRIYTTKYSFVLHLSLFHFPKGYNLIL